MRGGRRIGPTTCTTATRSSGSSLLEDFRRHVTRGLAACWRSALVRGKVRGDQPALRVGLDAQLRAPLALARVEPAPAVVSPRREATQARGQRPVLEVRQGEVRL